VITTPQPSYKFNPFASGFREDPYSAYRALRQHNPIHHAFDMWIVTRYRDVVQVLGSDSVSVSYIPKYVAQQEVQDLSGLVELGKKAIVFTDPPDHGRLRRLVGQAFFNTNIQSYSDPIQQLVQDLIAQRLGAESFDFSQVAHQIPLHTLSHMLGIPNEYIDAIDNYIRHVRLILEPGLLNKARIHRIEADLQSCLSVFNEIISYRKKHLGDDLLSSLIQAVDGNDKLSDSELGIACVMTFVAGHETSKGLLSNGVLAFANHPEQWQIFREGLVNSKQVTDEILRFDPPLQQTLRLAASDLQVGSQLVQKGEKLLLCIASANRDEEKYLDPDTFDVTRDASSQISFGHGMHNCLGQAIARLESKILFDFLKERVQHIELATSPSCCWSTDGFITRALTCLPVCLHDVHSPILRR
jgi:cytochrome P450